MTLRSMFGAIALGSLLTALPSNAAIVQGFVKDAAGSGISGVSVKFTGDTAGAQPTVTTDAVGSYSVSLSPDTYRVSYIPILGSRLLAERRFDIVIAGDASLPDVVLLEGLIVSGLVTDDVGAPLASVDLTFENTATGEKVFTPNDNTDAAGRYAIAVPAGNYEIEFAPPEFPPIVPQLIENVDITADVELPVVALVPGVVVNGTVFDESSVPVESVRLNFYDMATGDEVFTTDDSTNEFGVFRVVIGAGTYQIDFIPPGAGRLLPSRLFDVSLVADTTLPDIVLADGIELTGRVVDSVGVPIDNVDLDVFPAGSSERLLTPRDNTGADGRYRLIVPAGTFDLRYNPPSGSSFLRLTVPDVEITADVDRPDVVLVSGFLVTGRLVDEAMTPVPDVDLDFKDTDTGDTLLLSGDDTDAEGRFAIAVPGATYEIRFSPLQSSNLVPFVLEEVIDANRDLGDLQLQSGWGISGTVVDSALAGLGGIDVDVFEGDQGVYIDYDVTDDQGSFRVVVAPGTYRVALTPDSDSGYFPFWTADIAVVDEVDLGVVELSTGFTVDGVVRDQFDAPVVDATVELTRQDIPTETVATAPTDATGAYTLRVAAGTYGVRYLPPSTVYSGSDAGSFAVTGDTTLPPAVLERLPALTGRAVDPTGTGVAGVDVDVLDAVTGVGVPLQNDLTDAGGYFAVVVPDGTYRVRLEPPPESAFFTFVSESFSVMGDTDVGELVLPQGALISGLVVDAVGAPIQGVQVGVTESSGAMLKTHLADTDRGGQYSFLIAPGNYVVWYDPPPGSRFFATEIGPLALDASVELPPVSLDNGWQIEGRILGSGGTGLVGVDIDVLDEMTGASLPLSDDMTAGDGTFAVLVRDGNYRVRVEPEPLTRYLPTVTEPMIVGPDRDVGDLLLATGFLVEADVFVGGGQGLAGVDLDLVDDVTGLDALLVDERTDAGGHLVTAVAAGNYFAEYRPPAGTRWIAMRTGPHAINADTLLPAVNLTSGFLVSGTVVDGFAVPLAEVKTSWFAAGTCDAVFTVRSSTDGAGRYEVALPPGTYDAILEPPPESALVGARLAAIVVADQDVVLATETLALGGTPVEACNGIDDDCDGAVDENFPELSGECTAGLGQCEAAGLTVCNEDGSGTACDAVPGTPTAETCDGLDNDCDGVVDNGCTAAGFDLSFDRAGFAWEPLIDAVHYDVVRGDLGTLRTSGVAAALETCVADDTTATSIADATIPPAGGGSWFLVRGNLATGAGTWGSAVRDAALATAPGSCSP